MIDEQRTADAQPTYEVVEVVGYTVAEVGGREVMASCSSRGDAERVAMALGRRRASAPSEAPAAAIRLARFEAFSEAVDEVKAEAEFRRSDVVSARTCWLRIEELRSAAKPRGPVSSNASLGPRDRLVSTLSGAKEDPHAEASASQIADHNYQKGLADGRRTGSAPLDVWPSYATLARKLRYYAEDCGTFGQLRAQMLTNAAVVLEDEAHDQGAAAPCASAPEAADISVIITPNRTDSGDGARTSEALLCPHCKSAPALPHRAHCSNACFKASCAPRSGEACPHLRRVEADGFDPECNDCGVTLRRESAPCGVQFHAGSTISAPCHKPTGHDGEHDSGSMRWSRATDPDLPKASVACAFVGCGAPARWMSPPHCDKHRAAVPSSCPTCKRST